MSPPLAAAVRVRPIGADEADLLAELHGLCFPEASTAQSLAEILNMPGAFGLLAERPPAKIATGFAIARVAADEAELLLLGVIEPERRRGVATNLLRNVCALVREAGCRRLFLEVAENNLAAQALYRAEGFAAVGRRPDYYCSAGHPPIAALTLCRMIRSRAWRWLGL